MSAITRHRVGLGADFVRVDVDGTPVGFVQVNRDGAHQQGWDYDAAKNQVVFYGMACDTLKAGGVAKLDIVYGCPNPGIN